MKDQFAELVEHLIDKGFFLEEAVEMLERAMIDRALSRTGCNQSAASKMLGIHRNTLQRKMTDYQLDGKRPRSKPPARAVGRSNSPRRNAS